MTPAWLLDVVAALMLVVAAVSAARLAAARPWRRGGVVLDTDVAHLLMAIAMAGMLAPGLRTLPDAAWEGAFGLLAAWFAVRVARDAQANGVRALASGHCAPHLVHSCSMLYMLLAITAASPGMNGMGGMDMSGSSAMTLRYPTLGLAFAFILVGYSIWDLDQLSGRRYSLGTTRISLAGMAVLSTPVQGPLALAGADPGSLALPGAEPGSLALAGPVAVPDLVALASPGPSHGPVILPDPHSAPARTAGSSQPDAANDEAAARSGVAEPARTSPALLLSPAVTIACRIAMGVAMAFMLFIAI
jgi:opacity protein-like surface antigen